MNNWFVYIIKCSDNSLYTGITTDIERRFLQHKTGKGAKYFRRCQPVEVVYREEGFNKSEASKREVFIKSLDKASKLTLIDSA